MAEQTLRTWSEERFPMVLDDLRRLLASGIVIAEGAGLLPQRVAPLLTDNRSAIWLVATAECIRHVRTVRGESIGQSTSNPTRAFENLVARDVLMAEPIQHEASGRGLRVVTVDTSSLMATRDIVERHFAPQLPVVC